MQIGGVSLDDMPSNDDDLACEVCNTPLTYGGRGPKPKYCEDHKRNRTSAPGTTRRRSSNDVEQAMAAMDALYSVIGMALYPASPAASQMFTEAAPEAQLRNRMAFESDRELARQISSGASKGGRAMFYATNAMLIGPALRIAYMDMNGKRKPKQPRQPQPQPQPQTAPTANRESAAGAPPAAPAADTLPPDPIDLAFARSRQRGN